MLYIRPHVVTVGDTAADYATEVLADNPAVYWKMQETSGLPQDSSGNGLHMENVVGSPTYQVAGPFGTEKGIAYDDAEEHSRAVVSTQLDNVTYEWWMNLDSAPVNGENYLILTGSGNNGVRLSVTNIPQFFTLLHFVGYLPTEGITLDIDTWHHFAVVRRSSVWEYYFNGGVTTKPAGSAAANSPTGNTIVRGHGTTVRYSHIAFYNTALSVTRIRNHYLAAIGG